MTLASSPFVLPWGLGAPTISPNPKSTNKIPKFFTRKPISSMNFLYFPKNWKCWKKLGKKIPWFLPSWEKKQSKNPKISHWAPHCFGAHPVTSKGREGGILSQSLAWPGVFFRPGGLNQQKQRSLRGIERDFWWNLVFFHDFWWNLVFFHDFWWNLVFFHDFWWNLVLFMIFGEIPDRKSSNHRDFTGISPGVHQKVMKKYQMSPWKKSPAASSSCVSKHIAFDVVVSSINQR